MMFPVSLQETLMTAGRRLNLPETINEHDFALLAKREKHARTRIRLLGLVILQPFFRHSEHRFFNTWLASSPRAT